MKDLILQALGAGLTTALLWVPLAWLVMRKQFKLRGPQGIWLPYLQTAAILGVVSLFTTGWVDDYTKLLLAAPIPLIVAASVLSLGYRAPTPA